MPLSWEDKGATPLSKGGKWHHAPIQGGIVAPHPYPTPFSWVECEWVDIEAKEEVVSKG